MEDKLEVGQVREWYGYGGTDSSFTIKHIGNTYCLSESMGIEAFHIITNVLENSKPVKPEPKEIKVKWYRDNGSTYGSIFCTDINYPELRHWTEVDFIDGKFYEKGV